MMCEGFVLHLLVRLLVLLLVLTSPDAFLGPLRVYLFAGPVRISAPFIFVSWFCPCVSVCSLSAPTCLSFADGSLNIFLLFNLCLYAFPHTCCLAISGGFLALFAHTHVWISDSDFSRSRFSLCLCSSLFLRLLSVFFLFLCPPVPVWRFPFKCLRLFRKPLHKLALPNSWAAPSLPSCSVFRDRVRRGWNLFALCLRSLQAAC